jgi:hypothetical protein
VSRHYPMRVGIEESVSCFQFVDGLSNWEEPRPIGGEVNRKLRKVNNRLNNWLTNSCDRSLIVHSGHHLWCGPIAIGHS